MEHLTPITIMATAAPRSKIPTPEAVDGHQEALVIREWLSWTNYTLDQTL